MIGWLIDTNVIAELARRRPDPRVVAWIAAQPEEALFISVLTLGEFDKGVAALPEDAPERGRYAAAAAAVEVRFAGRIISIHDRIVRRWGLISGTIKRQTGHSPSVIDTLLAASAIEHRLYLATRNIRDVEHSGALVFNPWTDDAARFPLE